LSPDVLKKGACHPDNVESLLIPQSPYNITQLVGRKLFYWVMGGFTEVLFMGKNIHGFQNILLGYLAWSLFVLTF